MHLLPVISECLRELLPQALFLRNLSTPLAILEESETEKIILLHHQSIAQLAAMVLAKPRRHTPESRKIDSLHMPARQQEQIIHILLNIQIPDLPAELQPTPIVTNVSQIGRKYLHRLQ